MAAKHTMACLALEVLAAEKGAGLVLDKAAAAKMGAEMDKVGSDTITVSAALMMGLG
jgi:hypothetical protein